MSSAIFNYGLLSDEDKKIVDEIIWRLIPKDDEPITEHEIEALREMDEDIENGDLMPL